MVGSDTVRFCASCQKNVYNLSGMQRDEAISLMRGTEGRLCVRFRTGFAAPLNLALNTAAGTCRSSSETRSTEASASAKFSTE